jgi:TnpA family transposase
MLTRDGRPTQLGEALAHHGRIFKTIRVMSYVDDEAYRRQIKSMRNFQESRHDLGRQFFHGRKGELREAYHNGMEDQLGALGLVLNCITLWNTVYLDMIVRQLHEQGHEFLDDDLTRLSPYMRRHINVHGHYSFQPPAHTRNHRPLRNPTTNDDE